MKRTWDPTTLAFIGAIVMLVGTVSATGGIAPGQWRAETGSDPRSIRLDLRLAEGKSRSRLTTDVATRELLGFDPATFSRAGAPLRMVWKHDVGSFVLEGEGGRHPRGNVRFEPDPEFGERWRALGFASPGDHDLLRLVFHDVRLADAERLHELGYTGIDMDTFLRFESEPESMKWLEEMHALGLRLELEELFRLRSHGVELAEVRALQQSGVQFTIDGLIRLRNNGIDATYVKGLIDAGIDTDAIDSIVRLHDHGVPSDYVARVRATGFDVDVDGVIRLHDQGVAADYVKGLVDSQLPRLTLDDIVRLHAHGVPADYARAIATIGPRRRDADDVIRLHNHGVSADFALSLAQSGRRDLSVDDVIRAATHGPESLGER